MTKPSIITIDGPAGSGKSTLGELLARELGYVYFDTGVMYRALTLAALQQDCDLHDGPALEKLAHQLQMEVHPPDTNDGRQYTVLLNNQDVTWELRSTKVNQHVSLVSSYPAVRSELIRQQRIIGQRSHVVMVGRDIGRVVMPDAPLKFFLTASLEERARRRVVELREKNADISLEQVCTDLARRDELDTHVMQPAPDAILLQNDGQTPADTVRQIMAHIEKREQ
jgi:cytidylate kinase